MTRHSYLLDDLTCLADLLRIEDLRTLAKHTEALPPFAERELRRHDSLACFLRPELTLGRGEAGKGEGRAEGEEDERR